MSKQTTNEDVMTRFAHSLLPQQQQASQPDLSLMQTGLPLPHELGHKIYRSNAAHAQLAALKSIFPICLALVGETCFTNIGHAYIERHLMVDQDLNTYGEHFPRFLSDLQASWPALSALGYLSDMAILEQQLNRAYYAADPNMFDLAGFSALNPEQQAQTRFHTQAALGLVSAPFQLDVIYQAHENTKFGPVHLDLKPQHYYWVVHRPRFKAEIASVDEHNFYLLQAIQSGMNLAALSDAFPAHIGRLKDFISQGWICGLEPPQPFV